MSATLEHARPEGPASKPPAPTPARSPRPGAGAPSRTARAPGSSLLAAEAALAGLTLVTAATFWRVFEDWAFLPTLALVAVLSHLLAALVRRAGWSIVFAAPISALGLAVLVGSLTERASTRFGLPTKLTWHLVQDQLRLAWKQFPSAIAPVPAKGGFLVVTIITVWVVAFVADSFAFRARALIESLFPASATFIVTSAVADGRMRFAAAVLWVASIVVYVAMHRAWRLGATGSWLSGRRRGLSASAARRGLLVGALAIAAAAVVAPRLPGAGNEALVNTHGAGGDGVRTTISPLVDIKGRLSTRSNSEVFVVRSAQPTYHRLMALDLYDGRRWTTDRTYRDAKGTLSGELPADYSNTVTTTYTMTGLESVFLPAPFVPVKITAPKNRPVSYDDETETLVIKQGKSVQPGDTYTVTSALPTLSPAVLAAATGTIPADIMQHYLVLPAGFPQSVRRTAREITLQGATPYDKALELQNWFRSEFTYDLEVPAGGSTSAIEAFLAGRRGYCEQFSGTFAAMARSIGLPARVAVGFTQGERQTDGTYKVLGKHAHAWPEVYFSGLGWIPFEPTPGRGNPDATTYTGVPTQQADEPPADPTTATTTADSTPATTAASKTPIPDKGDKSLPTLPTGGSQPITTHRSTIPAFLQLLLGLVMAAALVAAWMFAIRRLGQRRWAKRRARASGTVAGQIMHEWHRMAEALDLAGCGPSGFETPLEVADRLSGALVVDGRQVRILADLVTVAAFAGTAPGADQLDQARRAVSAVRHAARARLTWQQRLRLALDPRPLVRPLPGDDEPIALSPADDRPLVTVS